MAKKEDPPKKDSEKKEEKDKGKKEEENAAPPLPPLEAAGRRLERLLGGGLSDKDRTLHTYSNPGKVVRRWLGTASGASGGATLEDISAAATKLLDPAGRCSAGRVLLKAETAAETAMDVEGAETPKMKEAGYLSSSADREVEGWLISLMVRLLWKDNKFSEAFALAQKGIDILMGYLNASALKITSMSGVSAASLYPLLARMFRFRSLVAESLNDPAVAASLRQDMARGQNMACLRRDVDCQATLINLMLQDLLNNAQVEQAQKLLANSTFPDSASNNQLCRYLYYSGRIQSLRLEYTSAFSNLSQCLRKAPTNTGLGFRIAAQRLLIIVQLLMGEIPDRHVFLSKGMKRELSPYLAITQAVRQGDLGVFHQVVAEQVTRLQQDGTHTLISRLAQQVVKAGLRKLHVSYSRLSLQDVADRLGLPSATSAEFVVAKAVRDGVLDATIHHEEAYVQSHDLVDVYATKEPAEAFHRRIAYCLTTHNDAVRAMRYPPDAYKKQLEASRGNRRKRNDDKTDEEKAQELEDELDEFD
ncbi:Probable 26S proteasome non-ATPase regulatory subunit 3 [Seminavis robusta]|uniref:Probable 26S proteasome non-ATPase regulatory subunit 3 n=1 Tax=Seminavis robusta TaxID=568900 RepID=A0A9N8HAL6_9STRA|nr:Probable 26S proteasome non-ATPase regulatory subunit 3 [Seminavis robusta]|eukprot:Sro229_g093060.1 Probable 26S proteasome non-ATPase regulatory subunit 3 (532) ;mRNA; r:52132-53814